LGKRQATQRRGKRLIRQRVCGASFPAAASPAL